MVNRHTYDHAERRRRSRAISLQEWHTSTSDQHNSRLDQQLPDPHDHERDMYVNVEMPTAGRDTLLRLSKYERRVCRLWCADYTYVEVAEKTERTEKQVVNAMTRISRKLTEHREWADAIEQRKDRAAS